MDYADIYYVDPRNADPRDHRTPNGTQLVGRVPIRPTVAQLPPAGTSFVPAGGSPPYVQPGYGQPMYPVGYPVPPYGAPPYGAPPWGTNPLAGNLSALVGGFGGLGSLADVIAQIFAAVMPLPSAPTPLGSDVADTNTSVDTLANSKNLITYQNALASYAKRDEQIRTIGSLLKKLVG